MSHVPSQPHALSRGTTSLNSPESVRAGTYTRWPSPGADDFLQPYAASAGPLCVLLVDSVHSLYRKVRHLHFPLGELDAYGVASHSASDQSRSAAVDQ